MEQTLQSKPTVRGAVSKDACDVSAQVERKASTHVYPRDDGSEAFQNIVQVRAAKEASDVRRMQVYADLALCAARATDNTVMEIAALCYKAECMVDGGPRKEALALSTEALSLAQSIGDATLEARAYFWIAYVALETNDEDQAEDMLNRCIARASEGECNIDLFWALNNLSHIHGERARRLTGPDEKDAQEVALAALINVAQEALAVAQALGRWEQTCFAMLNIGNAYFIRGNYKVAQAYVTQFGDLARQHGHVRLMAYANLDQARLLGVAGRQHDAIEMISAPAHLEGLCETDDLRLRSHETLYALFKELGQCKEALSHLEQVRILEARIKAFEDAKRIAALSTKLEVEEARAETQRIQAEAARLAMQNQMLERDREDQRKRAMLDELTGLGNRRAANLNIEAQFGASRISGEAFSIAYLDVDHFKRVNDQFGHPVGDRVLRKIAQILKDTVRRGEAVFRFGGEEFVALLIEDGQVSSRAICGRIRIAIERYPWDSIAPGLVVTASFGVATWQGETDSNFVISRADAALYRAKEAGRNRVVAG